jgi:NDP-sugar pyrophosphorylase family protein
LPQADKADFNDLIQFILDRGFPVHGMEIEHGWSEIHSQEDWQRVNAHFSKAGSQPALRPS